MPSTSMHRQSRTEALQKRKKKKSSVLLRDLDSFAWHSWVILPVGEVTL